MLHPKRENNKMPDPNLIKFIKQARKQGFSDDEIISPLLKQGWPEEEVQKAILSLKLKSEKKVPITINLQESVLAIVQKRAKKNLLSTEEQIQDIVRRSAVTGKFKSNYSENIDDLLVSIFSRKPRK